MAREGFLLGLPLSERGRVCVDTYTSVSSKDLIYGGPRRVFIEPPGLTIGIESLHPKEFKKKSDDF